LVGIVVVSHSPELASGLCRAGDGDGPVRMYGSSWRAAPPDGGPGERARDLVRAAIKAANQGEGVVVLGDLGSAFLTVRHVLERHANGAVQIVDAPLVEGVVAAAVTSSAGRPLAEVASAAEETARCPKALSRKLTLPVDVALHARARRRFRPDGDGLQRQDLRWDGRAGGQRQEPHVRARARRHGRGPS